MKDDSKQRGYTLMDYKVIHWLDPLWGSTGLSTVLASCVYLLVTNILSHSSPKTVMWDGLHQHLHVSGSYPPIQYIYMEQTREQPGPGKVLYGDTLLYADI